jgi:hypothetical protein
MKSAAWRRHQKISVKNENNGGGNGAACAALAANNWQRQMAWHIESVARIKWLMAETWRIARIGENAAAPAQKTAWRRHGVSAAMAANGVKAAKSMKKRSVNISGGGVIMSAAMKAALRQWRGGVKYEIAYKQSLASKPSSKKRISIRWRRRQANSVRQRHWWRKEMAARIREISA